MTDTLARWPVSLEVPVAWGEMDAFQHVNNTVYLRWFESARIAYFDRAGMLQRMTAQKIGPILARQSIDYRLPVVFPDTVTVSATVLRLGTTSLVMGYRLTSRAKQGALVAEGESVVVMIDYASGRKVELDPQLEAAIGDVERSAK